MPEPPAPPDRPIRTRTVTSTIAAVLMLLLLPLAAFPGAAVLEMPIRHGSHLRNVDWLVTSCLAVLWLLFGAVAYLRKAPGAAALVIPGLLGIAAGLVGIVTHLAGAMSHAGEWREDMMFVSVAAMPLLAGVGHLREARRRGARFFYVIAPLVAIGGTLLSVR